MSAPSRLETIKNYASLYSTRIPKAIGMLTYGYGSAMMARQCCLIAQNCAFEGARLSLQALKEKSLESANKYVLQAGLTFSVCQPEYYQFAALGIGAAACAKLTYHYAREFFKPAPPATPSPRK